MVSFQASLKSLLDSGRVNREEVRMAFPEIFSDMDGGEDAR